MKAIKGILFFPNALLHFFHVFFCHLFLNDVIKMQKNVLLVLGFCVEWSHFVACLLPLFFSQDSLSYSFDISRVDIYVTVFMGKRVRSCQES